MNGRRLMGGHHGRASQRGHGVLHGRQERDVGIGHALLVGRMRLCSAHLRLGDERCDGAIDNGGCCA